MPEANVKIAIERNELVSEEVRELTNHKPHFVIRKGNTIFLIVLLVILLFTWIIKYPDIIRGSLTLSAINAPKLLITRTDGKLQKLLVDNEQQVKRGEPLAFIQSTANHEQVMDLQSRIRLIEPLISKDSLEVLLSYPIPVYDQLGELQSAYQDFQNTQIETIQILADGYYQQKKKALREDLEYLSSIRNNLQRQNQLTKQDYELQLKEYEANESLAKDKVIAPLELNQNKSKLLGKEQNLEQSTAQLINNNIAEHNKRIELLDLSKYVIDQQQKFNSAFYTLKSKIEDWVVRYIVMAPEDGKVLFTSFLQENQLLTNGQELFYIQPRQSLYYGQMLVAQIGLGKIKAGQRVLIRVDSYPSNEFGYLTGRVNTISNIPTSRDSFLIKVDLPAGLRTNYDKTIVFRNSLSAQGEVMTDNRRLFDRFFGQLRDIIRR
jgi:multidrug resistance efflux pump